MYNQSNNIYLNNVEYVSSVVSFDFKEGYVDSFSLYYDLNQTEEENHYILLTAENKENDSTFAINDDIKEDILNSDEIISDDIL